MASIKVTPPSYYNENILQPLHQRLHVPQRRALRGLFNDQNSEKNQQKTQDKRQTIGFCGVSKNATDCSWRI